MNLALMRVVGFGLGFVAMIAAPVFALRPDAWDWLSFQLGDHIGAPSDVLALEPFDADDFPAVRLAAAGDVGTGGPEAHRSAAVMDQLEDELDFDALLLLGDNVYPDGDPAELERTVFDPFDGVLDLGTRLLAVVGNHDVDNGYGDAHADAIGMPARWYATRVGDVVVVALDSTQPDNPDQLAWLEETLAHGNATWIIATMHHPPYSGGYHGSSTEVRAAFSPVFERYGVQLVLAGHDHDYQRSREVNGVTYVVTGGAAKVRPTDRADFTEVAWSTYHFVDIAVWADRIELRAINHAGNVFDTVTLRP